jgi:hypothetical protein
MFERRIVTVPPGTARAFDPAEWHDAIVAVERGAIELERRDGDRRGFGRGDLLSLSGLSLRALRNPGAEPALLVAVRRRRRADEFPGPSSSQQAQTTKGPHHER